MKTIVTAIALSALAAAPAFAAKRHSPEASQAYARVYTDQTQVGAPTAVYGLNGRYLGQDPDPNVRMQLRIDGEHNRF